MSDESPYSPKSTAEADQSIAWLVENLPILWWGLYEGLTAKGFTADQSLFLIGTYVAAMYRMG